MSDAKKVEKEFKRAGRKLDKNKFSGIEAGKDIMKEVGLVPEIPKPEQDVIIPIPDENVAALEARRRRARAPGTGRDSTILTEGLGG